MTRFPSCFAAAVCHGLRRKPLDLRSTSMLKAASRAQRLLGGRACSSRRSSRVMPPKGWLMPASSQLEPGEIDVLVKWIAAGALRKSISGDVATTEPDPLVTDKDRDFWAFKPLPVKRIGDPSYKLKNSDRVRNQSMRSSFASWKPEDNRWRGGGSLTLMRPSLL
jgi:hypothetical protein